MNPFESKSLGGTSVDYINDTTLNTYTDAEVFCIQVLTTCTFASGTSFVNVGGTGGAADLITDGLPVGTYFIRAAAIKLASGSLLAYKYA